MRATCALTVLLCVSTAWAQPQPALTGWPALESYQRWYRQTMEALAADGVISPSLANASIGALTTLPEFEAARALLIAGDAAGSKAALVSLATEQKAGFDALRAKARSDRDWVMGELARRGRPAPVDLVRRQYISGQERDAFALGQAVNWKLPESVATDPGPWEGVPAGGTSALPTAIPFDLQMLWDFYRQFLTGGAQ